MPAALSPALDPSHQGPRQFHFSFTPKCISMLHFVLAGVIVNLVSGGSQDQMIRCGNSGGFRKVRGGFDDDEKVFPAGVTNPGYEL